MGIKLIVFCNGNLSSSKIIKLQISDQSTTSDLLALIATKLHQQQTMIIATIKRSGYDIRIIKGWPIKHYNIANSTQIYIRSITQPLIKNTYIKQKMYQQELIPTQYPTISQQNEDQNFCVQEQLSQHYQKLLKLIKSQTIKQFQEFISLKKLGLGECELIFMQKRMIQMLNQLGFNGWGALHTAIFFGKVEIVRAIVGYGADINKSTSDNWFPIQLSCTTCSNENSLQITTILIDKRVQLNVSNERGTPLHLAVLSKNKALLKKLLSSDIQPNLVDHKGRNALQVCEDQQCLALLNQYKCGRSEIRLSGQQFNPLASVYRGQVFKGRKFPLDKQSRYMVIDPYVGSLILYKDRQSYPKHPKEVYSLKYAKAMESGCEKRQFLSRNIIYYFHLLYEKETIQLACNFKPTVNKWINAFYDCKIHHESFQKQPEKLKKLVRNDTTIMDRLEIQEYVPKMEKENIMDAFLSLQQDNSESSQLRTCQSPVKKQPAKKQPIEKQPIENQSIKKSPIEKKSLSFSSLPQQSPKKPQVKQIEERERVIKVSDFKFLNLLGQGAFGSVFLARHISTDKVFALKTFQKRKVLLQKQAKFIASELSILKQINNPFTMNLNFTFQTPNYIYFGLDYCSGKDLTYHLAKEGNFTEQDTKFYAAEILLGLEHLHSKNILYRDMKPDNLLLTAEGHIKITDFGLSKQAVDRSNSFCGSHAYLSPEMIMKKGATKQTDFYGLGATMYEMIVGEPPFFDEDITQLYKNIKQGKLKFPGYVSGCAKSIISGLLEKNPSKRLGNQGIEAIKKHQFFKGIKWETLSQQKAPIRPLLEECQEEQDQIAYITNILHQDNDYLPNEPKLNKFLNFSFCKENCFHNPQ